MFVKAETLPHAEEYTSVLAEETTSGRARMLPELLNYTVGRTSHLTSES